MLLLTVVALRKNKNKKVIYNQYFPWEKNNFLTFKKFYIQYITVMNTTFSSNIALRFCLGFAPVCL